MPHSCYWPGSGCRAGCRRAPVSGTFIIAAGLVRHTRDHGSSVLSQNGGYDTSGLSVTVEPGKQNDIVPTFDATMKT